MGVAADRIVGHKEWAPGRKIDPLYAMSMQRARIAAYRPVAVPNLTAVEEPMRLSVARLKGNPAVFSGDGNTARWIRNQADLNDLAARHQLLEGRPLPGVVGKAANGDVAVEEHARIGWLGAVIGPDPFGTPAPAPGVDVAALTAVLAPALAGKLDLGIDVDDVRAAIRDVLGSLNDGDVS